MMINKVLSKSLQCNGYCLTINTIKRRLKFFEFLLKRNKSTTESDSAVLPQVINNKGILTLNRPKKLNAINRATISIILSKLIEWEKKVDMVIINGKGKAFSSGADIISLSTTGKENNKKNKEFFRIEYVMNCFISQYSVPYIALIDGITMGGGVGLSVYGLFRIATERTLFAMPETKIGFFTDIGIGHIFSRMPHHLGYYLALCGHRLKGIDVVKAGIATHYTKSENIPSILKGLIEMKEPAKNLSNFLLKHTQGLNGIEFSLNPHLDLIDRTFSAPTVEEIIKRLQNETSEFALQALKLLKQMSPTSLKLSKWLVDFHKGKTLEEGLSLDTRLSAAAIDGKITLDFYEGVRALLIDKDLKPQWNPATLEQVTDEMVNRVIQPLSPEEEFYFTSILNELRNKLCCSGQGLDRR